MNAAKSLTTLSVLILTILASTATAARISTLYGTGASTSVTFSGYTGPYSGNLGGFKGAAEKCNTAFSGSHVCSFEEITKLGTSYPYTYAIWFLDSFQTIMLDPNAGTTTFYSKTGAGIQTYSGGNCSQWGSASGSVYGFTQTTTGAGSVVICSNTNYLACCK